MKIALSADHTGFELLPKLQDFLDALGHEPVNYGPADFGESDDYPDFIEPAARAVANGECDAGVIFGGSGQGEAMAANRVPGVRCAVYYGPVDPIGAVEAEGSHAADEYEILRLSRRHNNANMLSIGTRFVDQDAIKNAIKLWLETPFSQIDRHLRRINKIDS
jgi:ribose 5-phosphate isomerase B